MVSNRDKYFNPWIIQNLSPLLFCFFNNLAFYYPFSSSCRVISMDIHDPFLPPFSIIHCFQEVFRVTSRICKKLLYVGSSWSSCLCSSMWRGPQKYITYEFVPTSPAVSHMSGSSNLDSFRDGGKWPYSCCLVGVLPPGLVQYCSQHSSVVAIKLFLHTFSWCPCSASIQQY